MSYLKEVEMPMKCVLNAYEDPNTHEVKKYWILSLNILGVDIKLKACDSTAYNLIQNYLTDTNK